MSCRRVLSACARAYCSKRDAKAERSGVEGKRTEGDGGKKRGAYKRTGHSRTDEHNRSSDRAGLSWHVSTSGREEMNHSNEFFTRGARVKYLNE